MRRTSTAEEGAEFFRGEQVGFRAVGEDAAVFHHDDAGRFRGRMSAR